jgi:hypothetical protein
MPKRQYVEEIRNALVETRDGRKIVRGNVRGHIVVLLMLKTPGLAVLNAVRS